MTHRFAIPAAGLIGTMLLGGCLGGNIAGPTGSGMLPKTTGAHLQLPDAQGAARTKRTLFIADVSNSVLLYPAGIAQRNPSRSGEITQGVTRSVGVALDGAGTLYVVNSGGSRPSIAEYKRGTTSPFKTITNGLRAPGADVVDSAGNLYVADGSVVLVYSPGAMSPSRTIVMPSGRAGVGGLAFDPNGNLLVDTFDAESSTATVYSVAPGSTKPQNLNLQSLPAGASLGADRAGFIYAGGHAGTISVYAPGSKTPARFINANVEGFYTQMEVMPNGTIYWPNYDNSDMFEFAAGASGPTNVFATQGSGVDAAVGSW